MQVIFQRPQERRAEKGLREVLAAGPSSPTTRSLGSGRGRRSLTLSLPPVLGGRD